MIKLEYPMQILDQDTYQIDLLLERSKAPGRQGGWHVWWQLTAGDVLLPPLPGDRVERLHSLPLAVYMAGREHPYGPGTLSTSSSPAW